MSPHVTAYFRMLGKRGKGASKLRNVDYYAMSQAGVAARKAKREAKIAAATAAVENKSES